MPAAGSTRPKIPATTPIAVHIVLVAVALVAPLKSSMSQGRPDVWAICSFIYSAAVRSSSVPAGLELISSAKCTTFCIIADICFPFGGVFVLRFCVFARLLCGFCASEFCFVRGCAFTFAGNVCVLRGRG